VIESLEMHRALTHRWVTLVTLSALACALDNPAFDGGESASAVEPSSSASSTATSGSETAGIPSDWWDTKWRSRRRLVVDNPTSEMLINAPLAVHLNPARINYADAAEDGHDLRLVDASDSALDLEIERWDPLDSSALWARVPTLPPGKTELWLYWDNPVAPPASAGGLWAPSYDAVYHLSERLSDEQRTIVDASAGNHGSAFETMSADSSARGVVGAAVNFMGLSESDPKIGDFIVVDAAPIDTDAWSSLTLEAWVRHRQVGEHRVLCKSPSTTTADHIFAIGIHGDEPSHDPTAVFLRLGVDDQEAVELLSASGAVEYGADALWHHLALTWDGSVVRLYLDGSPEPLRPAHVDTMYTTSVELPGASLRDHTIPVTIANLNNLLTTPDDARFWRGELDEIRLSRRAHTASWIRFQVESMRDIIIDYNADGETL